MSEEVVPMWQRDEAIEDAERWASRVKLVEARGALARQILEGRFDGLVMEIMRGGVLLRSFGAGDE